MIDILSFVPTWFDHIKPLMYMVFAFAIYTIFIFKFYRFTARKDIFRLYLYRRSTISYAGLRNFVKVVLYLLEYVILFPVVVFVWFVVLLVLFTLISKIDDIHVIITLSIALVATIRVAAYYNEDLAKDIAKLIPFSLLAYFFIDMAEFIVRPQTYQLQHFITMGAELPGMISILAYYLLFVMVLELALRILFTILEPFLDYDKDYQKEYE